MDQHICKNCGNTFTGKYCNNCGEKVYADADKKVSHFFEDGLHFITHFEGTFFHTIKAMLTSPGTLSLDYCDGKRKKYFKPLSLFLLLVVIYLLFPVFEGLNQKLFYHLDNILYGSFAKRKVTEVMQQKHLSFKELSEIFHHKAEKVSKFLLIFIIPFTALFFWVLLFKKRKYFFDSLIFSTEINCVFIIWGFLIMPCITLLINYLTRLFTGYNHELPDYILGPVIYAVLLIYTGIASRRFYNIKRWQSLLLALLFFAAHLFIVEYLYKFILFALTIYQI